MSLRYCLPKSLWIIHFRVNAVLSETNGWYMSGHASTFAARRTRVRRVRLTLSARDQTEPRQSAGGAPGAGKACQDTIFTFADHCLEGKLTFGNPLQGSGVEGIGELQIFSITCRSCKVPLLLDCRSGSFPPRQKSRVERLKAKMEPLSMSVSVKSSLRHLPSMQGYSLHPLPVKQAYSLQHLQCMQGYSLLSDSGESHTRRMLSSRDQPVSMTPKLQKSASPKKLTESTPFLRLEFQGVSYGPVC